MKTTSLLVSILICFTSVAQIPLKNTPGYSGFLTALGADEDFIYSAGYSNYAGTNLGASIMLDGDVLVDLSTSINSNTITAAIEGKDNKWYAACLILERNTDAEFFGSTKSILYRVLSDGSIDSSFMFDINGQIKSMLMKDGNLYLAGRFDSIESEAFFNVMRINIDEKLADKNWKPNVYRSSRPIINSIVSDDAHIYVGGLFTAVNGHERKNLVRVRIDDGTLDANWSPEPNATVNALILEADTIYAGGEFSQIGGRYIKNIAKIDRNNGFASENWVTGNISGSVNSLLLVNNHLYCSYEKASVSASDSYSIAKISKIDGIKDLLWIPELDQVAFIGDIEYINGQIMASVIKSNENENHTYLYFDSFLISMDTILAETHYTDICPHMAYLHTINNFLLISSNVILGQKYKHYGLSRFDKKTGEFDINWLPRIEDVYFLDESIFNIPSVIIPNESHVYLGLRKRLFNIYSEAYFDDEDLEDYEEMLNDIYDSRNEVILKIDYQTGEINDSWMPGIYGEIFCMVEDENWLYAGGHFKCASTDSIMYLAKINKDSGIIDRQWKAEVNQMVFDLVIDEGLLYAGGAFTLVGQNEKANSIARFDLNTGELDDDWLLSDYYSELGIDVIPHVQKIIIDDDYLYALALGVLPLKVEKMTGQAHPDWRYLEYAMENQLEAFMVLDAVTTHENFILFGQSNNHANAASLMLSKDDGIPVDDWFINLYGIVEGISFLANALIVDDKLYASGTFFVLNGLPSASFAVFDLPAPIIIQQPQDAVSCLNSTAKFSVSATSKQMPVKYQWQELSHTGKWIDIPEAETPSLVFEEIENDMNNWQFRCKIWNRNSLVISDTVTLNIYPQYYSEEYFEACGNEVFEWFGDVYSEGGTFYQNLQSKYGCDSIFVLHLSVNPTYEFHEQDIFCEGEDYVWRDKYYDTSGTYYDTLQSTDGCDSTFVLTLEAVVFSDIVEQLNTTLTAVQNGASYQWVDCNNNFTPIDGAVQQIFEPLENGSYAVEISYNGCIATSECFEITTLNISNLYFSEGVKVVPNPNPGIFEIQFNKPVRNANIELINSHGQVVKKITGVNGLSTKVELYEIPSGLYFFSISANENVLQTSFVVIK